MKKFNLVENIVFWFVLTLPTVWMCVTIQENCLSDSTMMSPQFLVKISSRNTTDLEETLFQWFEMCFECRTKLSQVFKNVTICESPGRYSHFSITSIYEHWEHNTQCNHPKRFKQRNNFPSPWLMKHQLRENFLAKSWQDCLNESNFQRQHHVQRALLLL